MANNNVTTVNFSEMSRAALLADAITRLNSSENFAIQLENYQAAREHANNQAIYLIYAELSAALPHAEIAALPEPGKDASQTNNPEIVERPNPKGGKPIKEYFYDDMADKLAFASATVTAIKGLEDAQADRVGAPVQYVAMSKTDRAAELNLMRQRRGNIRKSLRDCIAFAKQMTAVEAMEKVGVKLLRNGDGTVRNTTKPINVYDKSDPTVNDLLTAQAFIRLNVAKANDAAENPGSFAALMATKARGARGGSGNASVELGSAEDLSNVLSDVNDWSKLAGNKGKVIRMLEGDEGDDLLLNLYAVWSFADDILGKKAKGGKKYVTKAEELMGMSETNVTDTKAA